MAAILLTNREVIMKHLSLKLLAAVIRDRRKALGLSQAALSELTDIHCSVLSGLEKGEYSPFADQFLALSEVLGFRHADVLADDAEEIKKPAE